MRSSPSGWYTSCHINRIGRTGTGYVVGSAYSSDSLSYRCSSSSMPPTRALGKKERKEKRKAKAKGEIGELSFLGVCQSPGDTWTALRPNLQVSTRRLKRAAESTPLITGMMGERLQWFHRAWLLLPYKQRAIIYLRYVLSEECRQGLPDTKRFREALALSQTAVQDQMCMLQLSGQPLRGADSPETSEASGHPLWAGRVYPRSNKCSVEHYAAPHRIIEDDHIYCRRSDGSVYAVLSRLVFRRLRRQKKLTGFLEEMKTAPQTYCCFRFEDSRSILGKGYNSAEAIAARGLEKFDQGLAAWSNDLLGAGASNKRKEMTSQLNPDKEYQHERLSA